MNRIASRARMLLIGAAAALLLPGIAHADCRTVINQKISEINGGGAYLYELTRAFDSPTGPGETMYVGHGGFVFDGTNLVDSGLAPVLLHSSRNFGVQPFSVLQGESYRVQLTPDGLLSFSEGQSPLLVSGQLTCNGTNTLTAYLADAAGHAIYTLSFRRAQFPIP
jgi:hypothetical protein